MEQASALFGDGPEGEGALSAVRVWASSRWGGGEGSVGSSGTVGGHTTLAGQSTLHGGGDAGGSLGRAGPSRAAGGFSSGAGPSNGAGGSGAGGSGGFVPSHGQRGGDAGPSRGGSGATGGSGASGSQSAAVAVTGSLFGDLVDRSSRGGVARGPGSAAAAVAASAVPPVPRDLAAGVSALDIAALFGSGGGAGRKRVINCLACGKIYDLRDHRVAPPDARALVGTGGVCVFPGCGARVIGGDPGERERAALQGAVGTRAADADLAAARAFRDRLVGYGQNSAARSVVLDDQADFFSTDSARWLTAEEKETLETREREREEEKKRRRATIQVTLDLLGRRVVAAEGGTSYPDAMASSAGWEGARAEAAAREAAATADMVRGGLENGKEDDGGASGAADEHLGALSPPPHQSAEERASGSAERATALDPALSAMPAPLLALLGLSAGQGSAIERVSRVRALREEAAAMAATAEDDRDLRIGPAEGLVGETRPRFLGALPAGGGGGDDDVGKRAAKYATDVSGAPRRVQNPAEAGGNAAAAASAAVDELTRGIAPWRLGGRREGEQGPAAVAARATS